MRKGEERDTGKDMKEMAGNNLVQDILHHMTEENDTSLIRTASKLSSQCLFLDASAVNMT
jgi:hypothetical protein